MFKWLFIFLLLTNAILLFWHSLQIDPQMNREADKESGLKTLKLVSEMDPEIIGLQKKKNSCLYFNGFTSDVQAAAVTQFIVGLGGQASYMSAHVEAEGYVVIISLPEELERRLALMDYLETNRLGEISDELLDFEFKLEGYKLRQVAITQIEELQALGIESRLEPIRADEQRYIVQLKESVDRNLSRKIKEIVIDKYSFIKIEKKLCEGVAKP